MTKVNVGQAYERLTVIARISGDKWMVRCGCPLSTEKVVIGSNLYSGRTRSCGCLNQESRTTHGHTIGHKPTPEYSAWRGMIRRCYEKTFRQYKDYGGRGITVAEEWLNSFEEFYKHMGPRPSRKHSLDRKENNEGYFPGNVRWATRAEQNRNTRRNVFLTHNQETLTITDWAKRLGTDNTVIQRRLESGWITSRAVTVQPSSYNVPRILTIEAFGHKLNTIQWSEKYGIPAKIIRRRLQRGWAAEDAVKTPIRSTCQRGRNR